MILDSPPLSKSVSTRVNPCLKTLQCCSVVSLFWPPRTAKPAYFTILLYLYFLFVLSDLCGIRAIMQNEPNSQNPKTLATSCGQKIYGNFQARSARKNKPKQTQSCPGEAASPYALLAVRYTLYSIRETHHAIRNKTFARHLRRQ